MVFPVSKFVGLPLFVKIYPTVRRERFGAMVASIFPPKKEPRRLRIEFPNQVADIYCWNMVKDHGFSKLNFAGSGSFLHQVWDGVWMVRWCFMAKMWNWLGLKILHSAFIYIYIQMIGMEMTLMWVDDDDASNGMVRMARILFDSGAFFSFIPLIPLWSSPWGHFLSSCETPEQSLESLPRRTECWMMFYHHN